MQDELPAVLRTPDMEAHRDGPLSPHDELAYVLGAQCRALAATGGVSFQVEGFGQDRWPVDVETDLAVVLEQLPAVLSGLRKLGEPFQLNFYEQGIERYLTGTRNGDEVRFECMSLSLRWSPNPSIEVVDLVEAERMFHELRRTYVAAVERVCPWLSPFACIRAMEVMKFSVPLGGMVR